ncbi:ABC transporter substrate-binding protein [Ottowia sp.]|uniref:ABC transporter substrate-binding protein n=1 Tax=Ottowia sp. TaxID=1898956 RepID=UPI0039E715CC
MRPLRHFTHIALASAALCLTAASAQGQPLKEIRMLEAGGDSGEAVQAAYIEPFQKKTGIRVVRENPTSLGKLKAMVASKNITTPIVLVPSSWLAQAKAENLLEPLDWAAIKPQPITAQAQDPYAIGWSYFSNVMAWRSDVKAPKTWADFWNVADFPGKRSLMDDPAAVLPVALLADGVPMDKLFPLDVDRAFRSLEKIRPHVAVWWTAGSQPPQLLQDKEVAYAMTFSGRVYGKPGISFTYNQGILDLSYFGVPKGASAEQKAVAMQFFHELTLPENQLVAMARIPYSGASTNLDKMLTADKAPLYPTTSGNAKLQFVNDLAQWKLIAPKVEKRWQQFKLGM